MEFIPPDTTENDGGFIAFWKDMNPLYYVIFTLAIVLWCIALLAAWYRQRTKKAKRKMSEQFQAAVDKINKHPECVASGTVDPSSFGSGRSHIRHYGHLNARDVMSMHTQSPADADSRLRGGDMHAVRSPVSADTMEFGTYSYRDNVYNEFDAISPNSANNQSHDHIEMTTRNRIYNGGKGTGTGKRKRRHGATSEEDGDNEESTSEATDDSESGTEEEEEQKKEYEPLDRDHQHHATGTRPGLIALEGRHHNTHSTAITISGIGPVSPDGQDPNNPSTWVYFDNFDRMLHDTHSYSIGDPSNLTQPPGHHTRDSSGMVHNANGNRGAVGGGPQHTFGSATSPHGHGQQMMQMHSRQQQARNLYNNAHHQQQMAYQQALYQQYQQRVQYQMMQNESWRQQQMRQMQQNQNSWRSDASWRSNNQYQNQYQYPNQYQNRLNAYNAQVQSPSFRQHAQQQLPPPPPRLSQSQLRHLQIQPPPAQVTMKPKQKQHQQQQPQQNQNQYQGYYRGVPVPSVGSHDTATASDLGPEPVPESVVNLDEEPQPISNDVTMEDESNVLSTHFESHESKENKDMNDKIAAELERLSTQNSSSLKEKGLKKVKSLSKQLSLKVSNSVPSISKKFRSQQSDTVADVSDSEEDEG